MIPFMVAPVEAQEAIIREHVPGSALLGRAIGFLILSFAGSVSFLGSSLATTDASMTESRIGAIFASVAREERPRLAAPCVLRTH